MCGRSFVSEKRELDGQATGSIREAEAQRNVHRALFDAIRTAPNWSAQCEAQNAWDDHIAEHKRQAEEVRRLRVERPK
jgi:hypothetical protein